MRDSPPTHPSGPENHRRSRRYVFRSRLRRYGGTWARTLWAVLAGLGLAICAGIPASTVVPDDAGCLPWDRERFGAANTTRPAIARLAPKGARYGRLVTSWRADHCMRLNYIQVVGTHNSYHVKPGSLVPALLRSLGQGEAAASLEYTHRPLDEQLEVLQVRQLELDVFADPEGGLLAKPAGNGFPFGPGAPLPGMDAPGLKVLHIQDVDFGTTCPTFVSCLQIIRAWSDAHRGHLPLMVLVEAKDESLPPGVRVSGATAPAPFTADQLDRIDAEILSVFGRDRLMVPDDVRGERATLEEAVLKDGWPTLNELRGRVFFALDNTDQKRTEYVAGHPSLVGRVMFTSSEIGTPEAAFVKLNDPIADFARIRDLVSRGYLVRTRADANTLEARANDTERREAALSSGAQFVSTDYPEPDATLDPMSPYMVDIPGPGRCNPVIAPPGCDSAGLE